MYVCGPSKDQVMLHSYIHLGRSSSTTRGLPPEAIHRFITFLCDTLYNFPCFTYIFDMQNIIICYLYDVRDGL